MQCLSNPVKRIMPTVHQIFTSNEILLSDSTNALYRSECYFGLSIILIQTLIKLRQHTVSLTVCSELVCCVITEVITAPVLYILSLMNWCGVCLRSFLKERCSYHHIIPLSEMWGVGTVTPTATVNLTRWNKGLLSLALGCVCVRVPAIVAVGVGLETLLLQSI